MGQSSLHAIKKSALKKNKRIMKPVPSKQELAVLKEYNHWKDKIRVLQQVQRYQEKGEEQELKNLICNWRQVAQDVACKLACHFKKDESFIETPFWNDQPLLTIQAESGDGNDEDEMGRMLSLLHVDHDLIHYSTDTGSFYD